MISNFSQETLREVLTCYDLDSKEFTIEKTNKGHINGSYVLSSAKTNLPTLFLQEINKSVFPNTAKLMSNVSSITQALQQISTDKNQQLELIPIRNKESFCSVNHRDWRIFKYLSGYQNLSEHIDEETIYLAGTCIGTFDALCSTLPIQKYHSIISNFHDLKSRLTTLKSVCKNDINHRLRLCENIVKGIYILEPKCIQIQNALDNNIIPYRICHNDTKVSNIMYHKAHHSACMVDLDTVMKGSLLFDFGDAVRSFITDLPEDQLSSKNLELNWNLFSAFQQGFLDKTKEIISPKESTLLHVSTIYMPLIMSVRFISDYLQGDTYFGISHPDHNLHRAQNQLNLAVELSRYFNL